MKNPFTKIGIVVRKLLAYWGLLKKQASEVEAKKSKNTFEEDHNWD
jgi:hypothetical protein